MKSNLLLPLLILVLAVAFFGCEGPEGPAGTQGEQGDPAPQYTYIGDAENACAMCHGGIVMDWMGTHHPHAYDDLVADTSETNMYCVQCHVTGFDATVAYGDTVPGTPGPDMYGWDDYYPAETAADQMRLDDLAGVQCESCHGPVGPDLMERAPTVTFATRMIDGEESSMCVKCHEQVEEWHESGHGAALEHHGMTIEEYNEEFNAFSTCWECHTGEGFAGMFDASWSDRPEIANLIGCPSCHDPMAADNEHQLRNVDPYTVVCDTFATATMDDGNANLCAQCHHARRSSSNVMDQIANGYAHFGPHGSPQMDMYLGTGSYELDASVYNYDRTHTHQNITEGCVSCHMTTRGHSDPLGWKGGHDFEVDVELACTGCHPGLTTPNYNDFQTWVEGKLAEIEALIPVDPEYWGTADSTTVAQRMAGYAYVFVMNDGSLGAHNPAYTESLLENAIDFLTP